MAGMNIIEEFFDKKILAILKLFLFDETQQFYLRELSKKARVPVASTFRIIKRLLELNIIRETIIKKTKLYSLVDNQNTEFLRNILDDRRFILKEFVETVSQLNGVQRIILHGEEARDKANIIVIGTNIDAKPVKEKIGDIQDKYNFKILEHILEPDAFNNLILSSGGLSGRKVVLWKK